MPDRPLRPSIRLFASSILAAASLLTALPTQARITRLVIDSRVTDPGNTPTASIQYDRIIGRAFGELDPRQPLNAIIQDIELAPMNASGRVEYITTFQLLLPSDSSRISGLLWHDVPNRANRAAFNIAERNFGDVQLNSGWQGDNSGNTAWPAFIGNTAPTSPGATVDSVKVPIAKNPDGSTVTGAVLGRIVNRSGVDSQPIFVQANPIPYKPASLDTTKATLKTYTHETVEGIVSGEQTIASTDWSWGVCRAAVPATPTAPAVPAIPFPGNPSETEICVRAGFDNRLLYQVVFTAKDPYVLGVGFAAWRDLGDFIKNAANDDFGNANPVAGKIRYSIGRGVSQSGNYLRQFIHLGFNQAESGRQLHDGAWPIIAGRRVALNFRWAQPDGVLELYQAGSEGPQWWSPWPDRVRGLPTRGILDRCAATNTCPKIFEHFGSAEVWALKLTPEWVGTDARADIPLPNNVRRYYIPSSTHGGGAGGFNSSLPGTLLAPPNCPGNNFGTGVLNANPLPHTQTVNALRLHFRNWIIDGTKPPPSVWPRLGKGQRERHRYGDDDWDDDDRWGRHSRDSHRGDLVDADKRAMGFPTIPGIPPSLPSNFIMPVLDYDWGPGFNYSDTSGVPTNLPPRIKQVIRMLVPRTDRDGNERGGVPVVLNDAPLGTYLGWNITAGGARPFHEGQICDYVGGFIPFTKTSTERLAKGDPRPSLEERYQNNAGYVAAVRRAAEKAVADGFLLQGDADQLITDAAASNVLK